jgi:hypothetical protein
MNADWQVLLSVRFTLTDWNAIVATAKQHRQTPEEFVRLATLRELHSAARWARDWVLRAAPGGWRAHVGRAMI